MEDKGKVGPCFLCNGTGAVRAIVAKVALSHIDKGTQAPDDAWKLYPCPLCKKQKEK